MRLLIRSEVDLTKEALRDEIRTAAEAARFEGGLANARWIATQELSDIRLAAHRVYSQFGEDGVLQYVLGRVPIERKLFIEFGVQDYRESNTRFLLEKDFWEGVIVDPSPAAGEFLRRSNLMGMRTIHCLQSMVTVENINSLFAPWSGDIGLLSIDVDGVDYYLWEALEVVSPRVVIIEYQSNFGPEKKLATPYTPDFDRTKHHFSNLCAGASLAALVALGEEKGYAFVGTTGQHNAVFVRSELTGRLPRPTVAEAYRETAFRESRDDSGNLTYLSSMEERRRAMKDAVVFDFEARQCKTVGQVFGL
jgi:hypothetical protein